MARQVRQTLPDPPPQYDQQYIAALARSLNHFMGQATALAEVIAAHFVMTDPIRITGDLPTTGGLPTGLVYLKQIAPLAAGNAQVANPVGTNSTTYRMMGLNMTFTPSEGTRATFVMDGQIGNTVNNGITTATVAYGTGPPPANGAPLTGTAVGQPVAFQAEAAGMTVPFSQTVLLTGLVTGTTYWIGVAVKVNTGTSILNNLQVTGSEVADSPGYFLTVVEKVDPK